MEARRREPYDRERLEEDRIAERRETAERAEPRLVERPGAAALLQDRDVIRWGPIWGGTLAAFGILALLGAFGAAIGLTATAGGLIGPTAVTVWGAIIVAVSLFVGGYVAGRFSLLGGRIYGMMQSFLTWSTLLVVGAVLAAFGFGAGLVALGAIPGIGAPGGPGPLLPGQPSVSWAPFIIMLIGLIAALAGGYLGGTQLRGRPEYRL
jgi:hypothetical protein